MTTVKWIGRITCCDVCKGAFNGVMYDASLREFNCWANVCSGCFARYGKGLGEGLGQEYRLQEGQTGPEWHKTEG